MPCPRLLALLSLVPAARADVLVVAPVGAPYTTPSAAIAAAADGDTILVRTGVYPGFTIDGKALTVVADPERTVELVSPVTIRSLVSTEDVTLSGFEVHPTFGGAVRVLANAGAVRLVGLRSRLPFALMDSFSTAIEVSLSSDVAVLRCDLWGGRSQGNFPSFPGAALVVRDSRVAVHDSELVGGDGSNAMYVGAGGSSFPPLAGAVACDVEGMSELVLSGVTATGGVGGRGLPGICPFGPPGGDGGAGAPGGTGVRGDGVALVRAQASVFTGGAGGPGGAPDVPCGGSPGAPGATGAASEGPVLALSGPSRRLRAATHVRELNALQLELVGEVGDRAFIQVGLDTQWTFAPALGGVRLVGDTSRRALLGVIPAAGTLVVQLPIADLGPGVEAVAQHLQAFFVDVSNTIHLGGAQEVTLLDSAF